MASGEIWKRGWLSRASPFYLTLVRYPLRVERLAFHFINHAALHHELHPLKLSHVFQRVAVYRDDVGECAGRDHSDLVIPAEQISRVDRRGLNRLSRRESPLDHVR